MMLRALLVVFASGCVLARDIPQEQPLEQSPSTGKIEEKDRCLKGEIPTEACHLKCLEKDPNFESYCYKHTNECLCRPKKVQSLSNDYGVAHEDTPLSVEPQDGQGSNETSILRFMIITFIGPSNSEEVGEGELDLEESQHDSQSSIPAPGDSIMWSKERLAMLLMAVVILALVTVELCIMYRKRRSAHYLDDVFKTTQLNDKLVKFKEEVRGC